MTPGYTTFNKNRRAISRHRLGGRTLLVKDQLAPFVNIVKSESKLILWFSISKQKMQNNMDMVCGVIYISPAGSKYAHRDPYLELQHEYDKFVQIVTIFWYLEIRIQQHIKWLIL